MPEAVAAETTNKAQALSLRDAAARLQALYSPEEDTARPKQPPPEDVTLVDPEEVDPDTTTEPGEQETGDEAQAAAPDESATDDEAPEEPSQPKRYRVKANGEELEVTEDELLKGYSRTADYTRQKQQVTQAEAKAKTEYDAAVAERSRLAQELGQVQHALKSLQPQEPNWEHLRASDPTQYAIAVADWNLYQAKVREVAQAKQEADAKVQTDREREGKRYLETERQKLVEKVPSWKDGKLANQELQSMYAYAKSHGYTDEELAGIADHRVLIMLRDAWQHETSRKQKPVVQQLAQQKVAQAKTAAPGVASQPARRGEKVTRQLAERALKTGSLRDAAALFDKVFAK